MGATKLRKGGEQERVRCGAGGHVGGAEEHTLGLRQDFIQAEVGEPLEIREQESKQWGAQAGGLMKMAVMALGSTLHGAVTTGTAVTSRVPGPPRAQPEGQAGTTVRPTQAVGEKKGGSHK